jgi:hypothetical protein
MKPLTANLKHLYQCRSLWFLHVFILPVSVFSCLAPLWWWPDEKGPYSFHLTMLYALGCLVAHVQRGVLGKPFVYCLPGHHEMPRRLLFRLGWVMSLVFSLVYLNYPGEALLSRFSMVAANTLLGMALYLAAAIAVFKTPGVYQWVVWFSWIFIAQGFNLFHVPVLLDTLLRLHPLETMIGASLWALWAARLLSGRRLARAHSGELFLGFTDGFNRKKQERVMQAWRNRKREHKAARTAGFLESLFLPLIRGGTAGGGTVRTGWGAVYLFFAKYVTYPLGGYLLLFLGMVLCLGYLGSLGRTPFAYFDWLQAYPFLMVALTGLFIPLPAFGGLPLPVGRRGRFRNSLAFAFILGGMMTTVAFCIAGIAAQLEGVLPELEIGGRRLSFLAPDLRNAFLPLAVMPLLFVFQLFLPRHSTLLSLIPLLSLVWGLPFGYGPFLDAGPFRLVCFVLGGWALFAAALFLALSRKDLVQQGRG